MRKVQCIICDTKVFIDEHTVEAKRLKIILYALSCAMIVKVDSIHLNKANEIKMIYWKFQTISHKRVWDLKFQDK